MSDARTIDGLGPLPVARPASPAEVRELVRAAASERRPLYPVGGGTMLGLGCPPTTSGTVLDTTGLNAVIDYPARDMTVTVQAGITVAALQAILAAERQSLPVDIPLPERATVGGAVAANASGGRRYGYGTLRDYLIGMTLVNDAAEEAKAGGRVVKNVAGYDLCKLVTGSLGTLGVLTQLTFKTKPLPEAAALVVGPVSAARAGDALEALHRSRTRPVSVDLLRRAGTAEWTLAVGYEDNAEAVVWQCAQLRHELPGHAPKLSELLGDEARPTRELLRDFPITSERPLSFKATLLPSAVPDFLAALDAAGVPDVLAHALSGVVVGHLDAPDAVAAARLLAPLRALAAPGNGNLVVTRCPPEWKAALPIWGRPTGDRALMETVRATLDPGRLFNRGRFDFSPTLAKAH